MDVKTKYQMLENSAVKAEITVPKEEIEKEYNDLVNEYCKTVQIKGFRKGKVPPHVLIRKFGPSLLDEVVEKVIEKSVTEVLENAEKKPISYGTPKVNAEGKLELGKDFSFEIEYDTYPELEIGEYKGIEIEELSTSILKADIDRELKTLQDQNSLVMEKKNPVVAKDDIVTIDYSEVDEKGSEIPNTKREGFVFQVGTGYNLYKIDDDIVGMKKDEERVIKKVYPSDFETKELADKTVNLKVKVINVKEKQIPKIDDELAQDISDKYKTLDDLKNDIKKNIKESADTMIKNDKVGKILEKIVANSKIPVPKSMIDYDLASRWKNFVAQFRADEAFVLKILEADGKTKENILEEWKPASEKGLKEALVIRELIEREKIEVSDEEADEEIKTEAERNNMAFEDLKARFTNNRLMENLKDDIAKNKLFDLLIKNAVITGKKKVKYLDLQQGNY
ncbi:MAG: trigger factor [Spirochaetales bacterium]|nr:trigger factor [Spirochaetales bacterium]